MRASTLLAIPLAGLVAAGQSRHDKFDPHSYAAVDVITRDVAVIGGGASGTYGAIRLTDLGKSVVVVEKANVFGGHVNTYTDPTTNTIIDYGVQAYWNISVVTNFFARFKIPIIKYSFGSSATTAYADFSTGQALPNFTSSSNLTSYIAQLNKYPYLSLNWDLPSPVPADLLLTWDAFVTKYDLQDIAYAIGSSSAGSGDVMSQLTVNIMRGIGSPYLQELAGAAVTTAAHDNGALFNAAVAELGNSALLSSTVTATQRSTSGVKLVVSTPTGNKLIIASQLLVSIVTQLDNMAPFDLDRTEGGLFKQFTISGMYAGLISNTSLPANHRFVNVGANTEYNLPSLPGVYSISPTAVDGILLYWSGSTDVQTQAEVEAEVAATVQRLGGSQPTFLAFNSHTPFKPVVSGPAIQSGFYTQLNALQGHRNTWYTGQQWVGSSGQLWNFTESLLPSIVAAV